MSERITNLKEFEELLAEEPLEQKSGILEVITAKDLLTQDLPEIRYYVEKILPERGLAMLAGPFKTGKSFLVLQLAINLARGEPFLDFETAKSRVLLLSGEGGKELMKNRLVSMAGDGHGLENVFFHIPTKSLDLSLDANLLTLAESCKDKQVDVVIVDPLIKFNTRDENSTKEMAGFVSGLHELRHSAGVAVWMAHHTRKPGKESGRAGNEARGSSVLAGEVDSLLMLNKRATGDYTLHFTLRWAEEPKPIRLEMNPETLLLEHKGELEGNRKVTEERLFDLLTQEGPCDVYHLADITKTADKTVRGYLTAMMNQGLVDSYKEPGARKKQWFVLDAPK